MFMLLSTICKRATMKVPSSNNCSKVKYRIPPPFANAKGGKKFRSLRKKRSNRHRFWCSLGGLRPNNIIYDLLYIVNSIRENKCKLHLFFYYKNGVYSWAVNSSIIIYVGVILTMFKINITIW